MILSIYVAINNQYIAIKNANPLHGITTRSTNESGARVLDE
ncbi:hypothetical protein VCNHCC008D_001188 [Vibrio cholerae O1 str. NHCC-008D]|nr:hypothetical protein VCNHCC008D_001188 [Vibrio cholerae O1 str. NHCC-008D]